MISKEGARETLAFGLQHAAEGTSISVVNKSFSFILDEGLVDKSELVHLAFIRAGMSIISKNGYNSKLLAKFEDTYLKLTKKKENKQPVLRLGLVYLWVNLRKTSMMSS